MRTIGKERGDTMKKIGLSGNALKLIAMITMTVDHIGMLLLPQHLVLRIIGRLAFPIFAYMIAEGCRYTRSITRYFTLMAALAISCQIVDFVATGSLYQCILVTFSISILLAMLLRKVMSKPSALGWLAVIAAVAGVFFVTEVLPGLLPDTDYKVDYGFWGVMLPVVIYLAKSKSAKLGVAAVILVLLSGNFGSVQLYALLALPLLMLYNGERGKGKMKYLFYIYYPAHLAVLHLIANYR